MSATEGCGGVDEVSSKNSKVVTFSEGKNTALGYISTNKEFVVTVSEGDAGSGDVAPNGDNVVTTCKINRREFNDARTEGINNECVITIASSKAG